MSPRSRAIEILAAAGLGDQQLERERQRGQLAAENAKAWASLPSSLIPLLGQGIGAYQGQVQNEANTAAEQVAAEHIGDTGTQVEGPALPGQERVYAETPAQVAAKALEANKTLTPDKPTGFFDSLGALIGNRDAASAKARAAATAKIAGTVDTNRTEGDKLARQSWQDEQARTAAAAAAKRQAEIDAQAKTNEERKLQLDEDKAAADFNIKSFNEQDNRAKIANEAKAKADALKAKHPGGPSPGKAMQPEMLDKFVTAPRDLLDKLDALGTMDIPSDATGVQGALATGAEKYLPVGGAMASQMIAPDRNDVVTQIVDAVVQANNAMDRKTTKESMALWDTQLRGALAKGPVEFKKAVAKISADLRRTQVAREANLKASGFDVPGVGPTAAPPPAGEMVRVTDGTRTKTVARSRWEADPVSGWSIVP